MKNCFILLCLIFASCNHNREARELETEVLSSEIVLPLDSMIHLTPVCFSQICQEDSDSEYSFVVYRDSLVCSVCELNRLGIWRSIRKHTKELGVDMKFIFILSPNSKNRDVLCNEYRFQKVNLELYIDTSRVFERKNSIIQNNPNLYAFVLNRENHIEMVGDPSKDYKVEQLYYDFLKRMSHER